MDVGFLAHFKEKKPKYSFANVAFFKMYILLRASFVTTVGVTEKIGSNKNRDAGSIYKD